MPMNNRQKILSYLRNRKGVPVTIEQVAIGSKLSITTVGPALAQMHRSGKVLRLTITRHNRKGRPVVTFIHPDFREAVAAENIAAVPAKRIPYAVVMDHANALESAINREIVSIGAGHDDADQIVSSMDRLRRARDLWRDTKRKDALPVGWSMPIADTQWTSGDKVELTDAGREALAVDTLIAALETPFKPDSPLKRMGVTDEPDHKSGTK